MDVAGDFYRSAKGDQKDSRKVGYLLKNRIKNQRKSFFSLVKIGEMWYNKSTGKADEIRERSDFCDP